MHDHLLVILRHWLPDEDITSIERISSGLVNENYLIVSNKQKYVLRISPVLKRQGDIHFETMLLQTIPRQRFPYLLPQVIPAGSQPYLKYDDRFCVLFCYFAGYSSYDRSIDDGINEKMLRHLAELIVELHIRFRSVQSTLRPIYYDRQLKEYITFFRRISTNGFFTPTENRLQDSWQDTSEYVIHTAKNILLTLSKDVTELELVHGDIIGSNLLMQQGLIKGLVDFDQMFLFLQEYDLARTLKSVLGFSPSAVQRGKVFDLQNVSKLVQWYKHLYYEKHQKQVPMERLALLPRLIVYANLDSIYYLLRINLDPQQKAEKLRRYVSQIRFFDVPEYLDAFYQAIN